MPGMRRPSGSRTKRLTAAKLTPPDGFGWLGVAAMFLLVVSRVPTGGGAFWTFPLLSLGEWLLLPLGAAALTMGLLTLWKVRERTWLPLWMSGVVPGCLWLLAAGLTLLKNDFGQEGGDMFLSWAVRLIFPTMAFLPLLAQPKWRNRLMWALAGGIVLNVAMILTQARASGLSLPDTGLLRVGGLLEGQFEYGLFLAVSLPLLAAWRGGENSRHRALSTLLCTFLLPALALGACFSLGALVAVGAGLAISWAAWRGPAWIMGVFICLLLFGYGSDTRRTREINSRKLLAASAALNRQQYDRALAVFESKPFFGDSPEHFLANDPNRSNDKAAAPWYATLIGGTGLAGLGLWLVLLAELVVRAMGQHGQRCILPGGVLGGTAGLAIMSLWSNAMPLGAGAMIGLLLAFSIVEEEEIPMLAARRRAPRLRKVKKNLPGSGEEDEEIGYFTIRYENDAKSNETE